MDYWAKSINTFMIHNIQFSYKVQHLWDPSKNFKLEIRDIQNEPRNYFKKLIVSYLHFLTHSHFPPRVHEAHSTHFLAGPASGDGHLGGLDSGCHLPKLFQHSSLIISHNIFFIFVKGTVFPILPVSLINMAVPLRKPKLI